MLPRSCSAWRPRLRLLEVAQSWGEQHPRNGGVRTAEVTDGHRAWTSRGDSEKLELLQDGRGMRLLPGDSVGRYPRGSGGPLRRLRAPDGDHTVTHGRDIGHPQVAAVAVIARGDSLPVLTVRCQPGEGGLLLDVRTNREQAPEGRHDHRRRGGVVECWVIDSRPLLAVRRGPRDTAGVVLRRAQPANGDKLVAERSDPRDLRVCERGGVVGDG